jgi:hypothetical protein
VRQWPSTLIRILACQGHYPTDLLCGESRWRPAARCIGQRLLDAEPKLLLLAFVGGLLDLLRSKARCGAQPRPAPQAYRLSRFSPRFREICSLFKPSAAARTMRARRTSPWVLFVRRVICSSISRCRSVRIIGSGLGPGMRVLSLAPLPHSW